jgi:hypothetical protein
MQLEPQTRKDHPHAPMGFLDRCLRVAHHHEIIGVADQCAKVRTPLLPHPVEDMQVDVGEQRRDHAPYAKDNFQFERQVALRRSAPVLDLRRKK